MYRISNKSLLKRVRERQLLLSTEITELLRCPFLVDNDRKLLQDLEMLTYYQLELTNSLNNELPSRSKDKKSKA